MRSTLDELEGESDVVGQRPRASPHDVRVDEEVHVVDEVGPERLDRERRTADVDVEHARGLELLDRERVDPGT